jgi:CRISPR type IV-associated protein Csf2
MQRIQYEFILECTTPLAHHSEVFGNTAISMRRKTRQPDGSFVSVPIITADSMRHQMREASADTMLDAANLLGEPVLTEAAVRLLYAGGMITGSQDSVKFDEYRELCELCPPLGLLGGCVGNRSVAGKLEVSDALLICKETMHRMPEWVLAHMGAQDVESCAEHMESTMRVRMDPMLNPKHHDKLALPERASVEAKQKKREAAKDAKEVDENKCTMMPRTFETVVAGSLFYWNLVAWVQTDLELDTLNVAVVSALDAAAVQGVGGKRATGHGKLRPMAAVRRTVPRPSELATTWGATKSLAIRREDGAGEIVPLGTDRVAPGALLVPHVAARSDRLREWLKKVVA